MQLCHKTIQFAGLTLDLVNTSNTTGEKSVKGDRLRTTDGTEEEEKNVDIDLDLTIWLR